MSRLGWKKTRNCATIGRFPPTLVILRLGHVMAYGFRSIFREDLCVVWFVCDCVMVKDQFHGVLGLSKIEHCVLGQQKPE